MTDWTTHSSRASRRASTTTGEVLFPAVNALHKTIARGIVESESSVTGQELRFLRTMMGLTQAELARHVHHDAQSVARWEKNRTIQPASEIVIRLLAVELNLGERGSVEQIAARCVPGKTRTDIVIDGAARRDTGSPPDPRRA